MRGVSLDGRVHLLLDFAEDVAAIDVPDPYYRDNFEQVYAMVAAGCQGLLEHIRQEQGV
jgi:protein-tyrosine phosphatase